jgi:hypothetical protein
MSKQCVFNSNKVCNDCGECDKCDLNSNKKCNNCGKCLELQGYDMKGIKIDEILEEKNDINEFNDEVKKNENDSRENTEIEKGENHLEEGICDNAETASEKIEYNEDYIDDDNIVFIDDVEGLREILEGDGEFKDSTYEEFPGFIRVKK